MTKEQDFKQRLAAILKDMQESGVKDQAAMELLGSLALDLSGNLNAVSWSQAKKLITTPTYSVLLKKFEQEGNEHYQAGREKHAYAIQALAVSLVAGTMRADSVIREGEILLDAIIDAAVAAYRRLHGAAKH
ncbi:hypothetical protein PSQ90_13535 [Devosia rhodophyticola]|uniref:Uncharacterized protein n=1 Tax=Devosia rhodophyticola TaxID=3026423 RepID=A0ABY7YVA8_9HYPH|nr:hypothetical protein [Devosia rhodophyticola]WDR05300.1 hypothetical protein PSQ90_13535 [Devosia rhodophyticola]